MPEKQPHEIHDDAFENEQHDQITNLREQLDRARAELATEHRERTESEAWGRQLRTELTRAQNDRNEYHRQLRAIREARTHTCDHHCTEGGCDFDLGGFVDRVDEILAGPAAESPVPSRRAQDEPGLVARVAQAMRDANTPQAWDLGPQTVPFGHFAQVAVDTIAQDPGEPQAAERRAHAQGYAEAVARLRDDERYRNWWTSDGVEPDAPIRQHLADYLETVGPDGVDVETGRWPAREQAVIRRAVAWRTWYGDRYDPEYASACNDLADAVDALPHAGEHTIGEQLCTEGIHDHTATCCPAVREQQTRAMVADVAGVLDSAVKQLYVIAARRDAGSEL